MRKRYLVAYVSVIALGFVGVVGAQSLMPDFLTDLLNDWNDTGAIDKIRGFIRLALTLAFGLVILAAVAFSILAAIKYIRSQGDAGQVEEANKAIKAIFQGVIAMFVGIIGVVLVFFIFDVALPDPNLPTVCIKYPESTACRVCSEGTKSENSSLICIDSECTSQSACETGETPADFNF